MTRRAGQWLGTEAARLLATGDRVKIDPPLIETEFAYIEGTFGFKFADDHRAFLAAGLPLGQGWPDWRHGTTEQLRGALTAPVTGVLDDVERNAFWDAGWGKRPADACTRLRLARDGLTEVPQMVPIYGHRYLPSGRGTFGHPVLSIHQTDIICYGTDLVDYVHQEFGVGAGLSRTDPRWRPQPTVAFWSALTH